MTAVKDDRLDFLFKNVHVSSPNAAILNIYRLEDILTSCQAFPSYYYVNHQGDTRYYKV